MKAKIMTFDNTSLEEVSLPDSIFQAPVRQDILARMVRYQLAKRRSGTHKVKKRSEISATGAKMRAQKGSGGARHHARSANIFVGGGRAFGPVVRSHAHKLPKKVRALALKIALSSKVAEGNLIIVDHVALSSNKTKDLSLKLKNFGIDSALVVGGSQLDNNFGLAARNIVGIHVLPVQGINVYDILRHKMLIISKSAVSALESRLK